MKAFFVHRYLLIIIFLLFFASIKRIPDLRDATCTICRLKLARQIWGIKSQRNMAWQLGDWIKSERNDGLSSVWDQTSGVI